MSTAASSQVILSSEFILSKYGESLAGKTILITGVAGDSIAGELAVQVSSANPSTLILTARTGSRVDPIVAKIKAKNPAVNVRFLKIDLSDLKDTVDGVESQFGVNYLANFLLVKELLPKVRAAAPKSSIVICSSSAMRGGVVNFDDLNYNDGKDYDPRAGYGQSNAARTMFAKLLAEKLQGEDIRVFSIDPGAVASGLQRHFTPEFIDMIKALRESGEPLRDLDGRSIALPPFTGASEGAATLITAMVDPTIEGSNGAYLHHNAVADDEITSHVLNREHWTKLWALSEKLIGEPFNV
ncbi:uncharacterized protein TrAtP1_003940 [Trichoderma atroviride]|uniref:uncharacterized protein n=1 Tax=Hypocrea atroviridis TaxID=63577 RepID=UPI00331691A2|nr:hypothetical protein TrAtP1_003940 [Trichoderma atroviride]